MFNCGMIVVSCRRKIIFANYAGKETFISVDVENDTIVVTSGEQREEIKYTISEFDKTLVKEGGWVGYADKHY